MTKAKTFFYVWVADGNTVKKEGPQHKTRRSAIEAALQISRETPALVQVQSITADGYMSLEYAYVDGQLVFTDASRAKKKMASIMEFVVQFESPYTGERVKVVRNNKNAALAAARKFSKTTKLVYVFTRDNGVDLSLHTYYKGYCIKTEIAA
jgi:hypothetical protein